MSSFGGLNANRLELSEYASLLRALKTNGLLDISAQASTSQASTDVSPIGFLDDNDGDSVLDDSVPANAATSHTRPPSSIPTIPDTQSERARTAASDDDAPGPSTVRARRPRVPAEEEVWTRWPMKLNQLQHPEWSFSDEVHRMISYAHRADTSSPAADEEELEHEDEPVSDIPLHTQGVTEAAATSASHHLEHVLGALAAFTADPSGGLRGRMKGVEWESVLDVVGGCGLASQPTIDIVRHRMQEFLGVEGASLIASGSSSGGYAHAELSTGHNPLDFLELPPGLAAVPRRNRKYTFIKRQPYAPGPRKKKPKKAKLPLAQADARDPTSRLEPTGT